MQSFSLPLFDRLRQDAPDHIGLSDLYASLALDLDRLINTRSMQTGDGYLANELPDYGVPDFSIRLLRTQADRQVIETLVAAAIRRYEPRLLLDEVRFVFPETDPRRGHFRISGTLNVQPRTEHVTFEIEVETAA